jgi:catechol 2,3-dioxygenase-like lactoylglutathione lyase family enzyme
MKRILLACVLAATFLSLSSSGQQPPAPDFKDLPVGSVRVPADQLVFPQKILGISHVRFHVTNLQASLPFYKDIIGLNADANACKNAPALTCFRVNAAQVVQLDPGDWSKPNDLLEELGFFTNDVAAMHKFLDANGLKPDPITKNAAGNPSVGFADSEGHVVVFEEPQKSVIMLANDNRQVSNRLIHAGFVIQDRAAADHLFKDILGFHLYWQGGMNETDINWVAMQVPNGVDWLEYMLRISPTADHHTFGVMYHISLGVPDIHDAQKKLIANGWTSKEEPKVGRDGKWQLNVYDPDDTRIEFMEFTPKEEPCCSEFTGPHPGPQN